MITQKDLECEMEELRIEIKENAERIDKLCDILKRNNEKLLTLKQMNTNEAVENKFQNDNTIVVGGVKYQKVQQALTIYEFLIQCEYGELNPPYIDKKIEIETNAENFLNYLYEYCDVIEEDDDKLVVSISKQQMVMPND
jgi:hypothetical protein